MYRPKEEVAVKGYIRKITGGKLGDVEGLGDAASGLTYSVKDARNNEIAKGTGNLNSFGAFDFKFTLPDNANLGYSRYRSQHEQQSSRAAVTRTSFRSRNFAGRSSRLSTKVETEAPHFVGGKADARGRGKILRRRRPCERRDELDRNGIADQLHAAEPRRLYIRYLGAVVESLRLSAI